MAKPAWHIAVPGIMIVFAACSEASATYVGDRYFPSTVVTIVPTPADFLNFPHYVLLPETTTDTREHDFLVTYSKLITKDWALFFSETYRLLDERDSGTVSGFENLVLGTQYQLYTVPEHQFVVTVGGTASLGDTGSKEFGTSYSTLTPTIYVGKGLGDLPESMAWLQPVNLTANLGVALPTENTTAGTTIPNVLDWSFAVEYTMLKDNYTSSGRRFPTGWVPLVEVALTTPLDGPDAGFTTGTINPGFIWVREKFQFGLEGIVPINSSSGEGLGIRAQIHFYFPNIFPNSFPGKPIFD